MSATDIKEPRINEQIRAPKIRVVGADGEMLGVITVREALDIAREAGLDLVEVSPNAEPPVCKVIDYGKYKYMQQKRANEARKKQKIIQVKEVKLRPATDTHDLEVKIKQITKFLEEGDKVKITMRFRGREMAHPELGLKVYDVIRDKMGDLMKVEYHPKLEGKQMTMIVSPAR
jgi:translation initiation factor IF-3